MPTADDMMEALAGVVTFNSPADTPLKEYRMDDAIRCMEALKQNFGRSHNQPRSVILPSGKTVEVEL